MNFAPGDEVVCIGGKDVSYHSVMNLFGYVHPRKGQHYTVRGVTHGGAGIYLAEIINPPINGWEISWCSEYFRKIKPESIEIFRQMCMSTKPLVSVEP